MPWTEGDQPALERVRADIEQIANNCIMLNGAQSEYAALARQFQEFALSSLRLIGPTPVHVVEAHSTQPTSTPYSQAGTKPCEGCPTTPPPPIELVALWSSHCRFSLLCTSSTYSIVIMQDYLCQQSTLRLRPA